MGGLCIAMDEAALQYATFGRRGRKRRPEPRGLLFLSYPLSPLDGEAAAVGQKALSQFSRRDAGEVARVTIEVRLIEVASTECDVGEIGRVAGPQLTTNLSEP